MPTPISIEAVIIEYTPISLVSIMYVTYKKTIVCINKNIIEETLLQLSLFNISRYDNK